MGNGVTSRAEALADRAAINEAVAANPELVRVIPMGKTSEWDLRHQIKVYNFTRKTRKKKRYQLAAVRGKGIGAASKSKG